VALNDVAWFRKKKAGREYDQGSTWVTSDWPYENAKIHKDEAFAARHAVSSHIYI